MEAHSVMDYWNLLLACICVLSLVFVYVAISVYKPHPKDLIVYKNVKGEPLVRDTTMIRLDQNKRREDESVKKRVG